MCGICGEWNDDGASLGQLVTMADKIRHRGPDDDGFYVHEKTGLASRRLSIIDLSTGKQPIFNEDQTIAIVFNGEIYNYPELRQHLIECGHQFVTKTDTEVIVHLYEQYGVDSVKKLQGMFSFAIWDDRQQRLFIARDPLGQKHIYYRYQPGRRFMFGSEIKALLEDDFTRALNTRAMHNLLSLRCIPDDDTLFEGIQKLPAGHFLLLENGQLTISQYWDLQYTNKLSGSDEDITEQLRQLLVDTVQSHMLSDVPLGTFLSGGIDSSLITAIMCELSSTPVKTFAIGVTEDSFNELPYARQVAERYHTEHHEFVVEPNFIATLPEMMWYMEEPVDPFAFGVYSVSKLARQHVKVALGGDGGDEMFAGYDRYVGNQLVDLYCLLPRAMRSHIVEPIIRQLPDNFSYNNRVQKLRWMVAMSNSDASERYAQSAIFLRFSHEHKQELYSTSLWQQLERQNSMDYLVRLFEADNAHEAVDKMLYTDVKSRLADHLLVVNDRMTMAHSLEGRSPYVDHKLAEFAAAVPSRLKIHGRRLKHILRQVSKAYLPDDLVERPKHGFSFPLAFWFRNELRELTRTLFQESRLVAAGYFRPEAMLSLLDEHVSGEVDNNYRLWLLLNLELWYRLYIENTPVDTLQGQLVQSLTVH
ncbi:MAG TPA: asparagine synthase (glutamine-hydrolyzing) [Phototrophicaceae bacterium]|nr:asparagine synthase (glutamine-hydrolyzing) [Phototrophicaceae bacterium]